MNWMVVKIVGRSVVQQQSKLWSRTTRIPDSLHVEVPHGSTNVFEIAFILRLCQTKDATIFCKLQVTVSFYLSFYHSFIPFHQEKIHKMKLSRTTILTYALLTSSSIVSAFTSPSFVARPTCVVCRPMTATAEASEAPAAEEASAEDAEIQIPTNLPSACGMDYVPLATMLATGDLVAADQVSLAFSTTRRGSLVIWFCKAIVCSRLLFASRNVTVVFVLAPFLGGLSISNLFLFSISFCRSHTVHSRCFDRNLGGKSKRP